MSVCNTNHSEQEMLCCLLLCTQIRLKSPLEQDRQEQWKRLPPLAIRESFGWSTGAPGALSPLASLRQIRAFLLGVSDQPASSGKYDQRVLVPLLPVGCMHANARGCTLSLTPHEILIWLIQPARSVLAADALEAGVFPSHRLPKTNRDWANPTAPRESTNTVLVGAMVCTKSID